MSRISAVQNEPVQRIDWPSRENEQLSHEERAAFQRSLFILMNHSRQAANQAIVWLDCTANYSNKNVIEKMFFQAIEEKQSYQRGDSRESVK